MSQLPFDQAVQRFKENEDRVDIFVNDPLGSGHYTTNESVPRPVETLPSFMSSMRDRYWTLRSRGAWATGTEYLQNDLVYQSGIVYLVVIDHTSGTFASDLSSGKVREYQVRDAEFLAYTPAGSGAVAR